MKTITQPRIKVKIPKLGLTIETAKLIEWSKPVGSQVAVGESLGMLEVDKATQDLESPAAGTLVELLVAADPEVDHPVGTEVAVIEPN